MVDPALHPALLRIVREAIREGASGADLDEGIPERAWIPASLHQVRCASFVTLSTVRGRQLRGCCGCTVPELPLPQELRLNAWRTAFSDPRFPSVRRDELAELHVEVSLLSPLQPVIADSEEALLAALEVGRSGLVIDDGLRKATFLPKVWQALPEPRDFLMHLKHKAGLGRDEWPPGMRALVYTTETFGGSVEPALT